MTRCPKCTTPVRVDGTDLTDNQLICNRRTRETLRVCSLCWSVQETRMDYFGRGWSVESEIKTVEP